ncbi:MAG TPA: GNAT family N-acetyltransferase [Candidatus Cybelea sp.]|jgi:predicted N-acetyltransferase YhbS|nr:GNAT family N-acetyltransferase [Candidatus Cybelea sp.]
MAEIAIASPDDVRQIQRRRSLDDLSIRLSLQAVERNGVWVARDEGEVIGIAVARDSQDERFVGDLFVEPSYRDAGIGASMIEAAFGSRDDAGRAMLVGTGDAAALTLALRFRMAPNEVLLRFAGAIPREEELAKMAAGDYRFEVAAVDAAMHAGALNELDRQARGTIRAGEHEEFARNATGHAFFLGGESIGYAYVWPDGHLGPMACAAEAYLVQILAYALVTMQRKYSATWCTALVPGSNRRIARAALRAGLRIEESFLLAHDSFIGEMSTYVAYHRMLL